MKWFSDTFTAALRSHFCKSFRNIRIGQCFKSFSDTFPAGLRSHFWNSFWNSRIAWFYEVIFDTFNAGLRSHLCHSFWNSRIGQCYDVILWNLYCHIVKSFLPLLLNQSHRAMLCSHSLTLLLPDCEIFSATPFEYSIGRFFEFILWHFSCWVAKSFLPLFIFCLSNSFVL